MLQYYDELLYFAQKLVGDKEKAKDIIQETYTKVLEINKSSHSEIKRAYLYKMVQNLVIDKARREKVVPQITYNENEHFIQQEDFAEEIISQDQRQNKLRECIKNLSPQNKKAFVLHYYKGYTRKEIGQILNISVNAVEKNITRAVLKIKEEMKKDY